MIPDTPTTETLPTQRTQGHQQGLSPLTAHRDSRGQSLLLVVIAGTGGPTSDLTSELFYQLWVLLLHLLGKLLAAAGEAGPSSTGRPRPLLALLEDAGSDGAPRDTTPPLLRSRVGPHPT